MQFCLCGSKRFGNICNCRCVERQVEVLAFAQGMYGSDYTSVNYATVYPLSMFMRVLVAQVLILISFS